jgi:hypothetical protein
MSSLFADLKLAQLPTSLAATHRGFAFYVADPTNSIRRFSRIAELNEPHFPDF